MKKRHCILLVVLLLLVVIGVCAGLRFYPIWKAAGLLRENMDLKHFSYELQVELDEKMLSEQQNRLFDMVAKLTGYSKEALCRLTIKGSVWEEKIYALIYPENASDALMELYLSEETDVINETMIYNAIRAHLVGRYTLLGYLMPEQKGDMYMTLEQVEQIFDIDLSGLRDLEPPSGNGDFSARQCFAMLAKMTREKQANGDQFKMETERMQLYFNVPTAENEPAVTMHLYFPEAGDLLKNLSVDLTPIEGAEPVMPTDFVNQGTVDLISQIRAWIEKIFGEE